MELYYTKRVSLEVVMGKIYCIMGKSASGKDTIYKEILRQSQLKLQTLVTYTTRPIREGEKNGVEYFFSNDEELERFRLEGKLIEVREYHTVHGVWKYFTVDDGRLDLKKSNYIFIGTLESYVHLRNYYGKSALIPIYINLEDGIRLNRALIREKQQEKPRYAELCRRYLADDEDFSQQKLKEADVDLQFENDNLDAALKKILEYMEQSQGE